MMFGGYEGTEVFAVAYTIVSMNAYTLLLTFGHGTRLVIKPSKISEIWDSELFSGQMQSTQTQGKCLQREEWNAVQKEAGAKKS